MGNWKTVNIRGKIDASDVENIVAVLNEESCWKTPAACLSIGESMCGLNCWIESDGAINASGNLSERDFTNDDIDEALQYLATLFPSLDITLHAGGDFESLECTATFHVNQGVVCRCSPEVKMIEKARYCPYWERRSTNE